MNLNPPRQVRAVLYLIGAVGILVLTWAQEEGWLDGPTHVMLAGVLALVSGLAVANTATPPQDS